MEELSFKRRGPINVHCDSTSAIKLANNPAYCENTKHVEADCHFLWEKIEKEDMLLIQVCAEDLFANSLTKVVNKANLHHVFSKLGVLNIYAPA